VTGVVVLPASLVAGAQYPLLIALLGKGRREVGREIGIAAAFNTGGAMVGALAGGFLLLPALSATGCWRASVVLLGALGGLALWLAARWQSPPPRRDGGDADPAPWAPHPGWWIRRLALPAL